MGKAERGRKRDTEGVETDRQTDRQTKRQTERQTEQTERQKREAKEGNGKEEVNCRNCMSNKKLQLVFMCALYSIL